MAKLTDIDAWRMEIEMAENFRDEEFGEYTKENITGAGENIDYYEKGFFVESEVEENMLTTLNIVDALVSIIVPTLKFQRPKTIATPGKIESEDTAPIAAHTIDYYRRKLESQIVNNKIIWDAYVLGYGCYKQGYTTKFGKDVEDKTKKKVETLKDKVDKGLQAIGLKEKKKEDVIQPDIDLRIVAESPFIEYISPFDFIMDPRAKSLDTAQWWGQRFRKTIKSLKDNPRYTNTDDLKGDEPQEVTDLNKHDLNQSEIEAFHTAYLYEIHYRNDDEFYLLYLTKDKEGNFAQQYHDESIYELDEWQADVLKFKKHTHKPFPKSDITKIKNLADRITSTIDAILEQVDRFAPKIAYDMSGPTNQGKKSLIEGGTGALVECNSNPTEIFKELNFTQLKADLANLLDQIISLISIQTGLTRAQLTGVSDSGSATEATIEQGGQNIRMSDMKEDVRVFVNRQSNKLWKIVTQFVDLEQLQLINGVKGIDPKTGIPRYNWLEISSEQRKQLVNGEYDFDMETGSTEKINLAVVRKAFENWFNILAKTEVIALMQAQGHKFNIAEFAKKGMDAFPELGIDSSKVIQPITEETQGLIPPEMIPQPGLPPGGAGAPGGTTAGSNTNELRAQRAEGTPSTSQAVNEVF